MSDSDRPSSTVKWSVTRVRGGKIQRLPRRDSIVTEEPLEIRLVAGAESCSVAVTMRTPTGTDFELAAGFLFSEGVIRAKADISSIAYCVDAGLGEEQQYNVVNIRLRSDQLPDLPSLERHFTVNSACGVCGKAHLDSIAQAAPPITADWQITPAQISAMGEGLRTTQPLFDQTGGLHAAALFHKSGELWAAREDVGRHNAFDKLVGWALMNDRLPLSECVVVVSGRASFELVQKAAMAGIPFFCAVSAPSHLAVRVAHRQNITLVGFLRGADFNIYTYAGRITTE